MPAKMLSTREAAPLSRRDALLVALFVAAFFFLTWIRRHGIFSNDEVEGWLALIQPSWSRVMQVWSSGVDSSGLWFYVFARPWMHLFGFSDLSLHLWTTFFVSLSFGLTWICARRFASTLTVAVFAPLVFLANRVVILQLNNGRTYGILLLATALTCYAMLRTDPAEPDFGHARPVLLSFFAFLLLTGSHTLGVLFWGMFLAAFCLRDLLWRVFQWKVYLGALVSLALIVPVSRRNIQADLDMGKPTFWTPMPTLHGFVTGVGDFSDLITGLIFLLLIVSLVLFYRQPVATRGALIPRARFSLYCLLAVFPALVLVTFALSLLGKSIFTDRYLISVAIGDVLVLCELATRIELLRPLTLPARRALAAAAALGLAALFVFNFHRQGSPQPDYTQAFLKALPAGKPVVITDTAHFIEVTHYHNNEREMVIPLDWTIQLDPDFGGGGASFSHEMEDWKSVGLYPGQILTTPEILAKYPSFLLVSDEAHTLWFRRYIAANPGYQATELPGINGDRVWSVQSR